MRTNASIVIVHMATCVCCVLCVCRVARRVLSDVFTDTTAFIDRLEKAAWGGGGGGGGEGKGGKRSGVSVCCSMFLCTPAELVGVLGAACKLMEGEEVVKRVSVGAKASSKAVKVIGSIYGQVSAAAWPP